MRVASSIITPTRFVLYRGARLPERSRTSPPRAGDGDCVCLVLSSLPQLLAGPPGLCNDFHEVVELYGLAQVGEGPQPLRLPLLLFRSVTGEDHDLDLGEFRRRSHTDEGDPD